MEQNNLVVTPDGKTWDEVTRDTSYLGSLCVHTSTATTSTSGTQIQVFDHWRGKDYNKNWMNKDFAIANDRIICLKDGQYTIHSQTLRQAAATHCFIKINGSTALYAHAGSSNHDTPSNTINLTLKRGDYIQNVGGWFPSTEYSHFQIYRS